MSIPAGIDRNACADLDAKDPLARFRERFVCDDGVVYLDGNSLGRLPRDTPQRVATLVAEEWGRDLITSWTAHGWMESPLRLGDRIGELIGAPKDTVLVTDSTSVDLFKLIAAVLQARPNRRVIVSERENFPTDIYVARGTAELLGGRHELRLVPRSQLADALDGDTALLMLTHVDFRSGERHDMAALTDAAHRAGALALWDLSHSAGALHVDIDAANADLAVGCGYKYLNGGPGAPAFIYVPKPLQAQLRNPIQGWLGHESPFTFDTDYRGATGARGWMSGSPPIIAIAALAVGVDLILEAGSAALEAKASALTELFMRLADERLSEHGFTVVTPRDASRRGAHVSLRHREGYPIVRALIDRGVIGDFRDPDICRFGFAPIYTRFVDVWDAVEVIDAVMRDGAHRRAAYPERAAIT